MNTPPVIQQQRVLPPGNFVCESCGMVGDRRTVTPGSIWIELLLWLFFILPGVIYSIWRLASRRHDGCRFCSGKVIPVQSPRGFAMVRQFYGQ